MSESEKEEITLREFFVQTKEWGSYVFRYWGLIALFVVVFAGIGLVYSLFKKPMYVATLSFAIEDEKGGGFAGALGIASSLGFDMGGDAGSVFSGANLIELMKSRKIVQDALMSEATYAGTRKKLIDVYIDYNELRKDWAKRDAGLNSALNFSADTNGTGSHSVAKDSVMGLIYYDIVDNLMNVGQKDKKVSIITLTIKSPNEFFSKYFTEAIAQVVSDFYIATKSKKSRMHVEILEKQRDSIRVALNSAITGVAASSDEVYNLNPAMNLQRVPSTRRQVDVQANTAILTELVKNLEMARMALRRETPLIQVIDTPILPLAKQQLGKRKALVNGGLLGLATGLFVVLFRRFWAMYVK